VIGEAHAGVADLSADYVEAIGAPAEVFEPDVLEGIAGGFAGGV